MKNILKLQFSRIQTKEEEKCHELRHEHRDELHLFRIHQIAMGELSRRTKKELDYILYLLVIKLLKV